MHLLRLLLRILLEATLCKGTSCGVASERDCLVVS